MPGEWPKNDDFVIKRYVGELILGLEHLHTHAVILTHKHETFC